jgi:hypothetical protein
MASPATISDAQLAANRGNAQQATGPRKSRTRLNSTRQAQTELAPSSPMETKKKGGGETEAVIKEISENEPDNRLKLMRKPENGTPASGFVFTESHCHPAQSERPDTQVALAPCRANAASFW